MLQLSLVPRT